MRSRDGEFEEPDDQQRLTDEREDADGQRVAGNQDRAERVGQVADAGEGDECPEDLWEVDGLEQQSAEPDEVPWAWRRFAFRSYMALQRVDNQVLEPRLPPQLFYNLLVSARRP